MRRSGGEGWGGGGSEDCAARLGERGRGAREERGRAAVAVAARRGMALGLTVSLRLAALQPNLGLMVEKRGTRAHE
eukprot:scaffold16017_cov24-Tisochrysis_lutea.AAC.2